MENNSKLKTRKLDMSDFIMNSDCYNSIEYCAYKIEPELRNCQCCSLTHYFHDCNGNPIKKDNK